MPYKGDFDDWDRCRFEAPNLQFFLLNIFFSDFFCCLQIMCELHETAKPTLKEANLYVYFQQVFDGTFLRAYRRLTKHALEVATPKK